MNIKGYLSTAAFLLAIALSGAGCGSPAGPETQSTPEGPVVAWFNCTGYTVDLYFPRSDSLVSNAYTTGEVPGDILSHEEGTIAVLNSLDCTVQVFAVDSTGSQLLSVQLPSGSNPYHMSWDGNSLWVTLLLTSEVARVDMELGGSVTLFDTPPNPTSIAADGEFVFVGHGNWPDPSVTGGISVLDASTGDLIDSIATPDNVCFMEYFSSTGKIHAVTCTYTGDGRISVIDPLTMGISTQIHTGGSPCRPTETPAGFAAGDGWSSGSLFLYGESGALETWNTGIASSAGVACIGDTLYVTDPLSDLVIMADIQERTLLDTLPAGSSGPQGIRSLQR